ncbi:MAG: acyl-CoA thioesterase [Saprospiraceae bacterium]|nr:acyl-CoA thioesterase [Saprospiraceae bacterium]MCF8251677.1 acyl-CoA thioesterase [Saprospiraceae bacterium]MCF8283033.1 acyl-CoA thioesterase [Bacteroidales bacterium]MCF8311258.1 acyl-CoA thioesterase [Saprospiraceae bacterium]MCF8442040.1 acyl-CoA thioesterase [Saprospiraceae bacterium]
MDIGKFNFTLPIQVRWSDLDPLGHVNNAVFVTYFEIVRGHFMINACPGWDWKKDMFLIANVTANLHKELLLTAVEPAVNIRTSKIGNKSFVLEYAVTSKNGDKTIVHATGTTTQIMFDMKTRTTIEIPDWVRRSLGAFDGL